MKFFSTLVFYIGLSVYTLVYSCWDELRDNMIVSSIERPEVESKIQTFMQNANAYWNLASRPVFFKDNPPNFRSCPDGRVFIGVNLLEQTIKEEDQYLTLYLYLSHEMAHQVQYIYLPHIFSRKTDREIELQADCLGSFYLGTGTEIQPTDFLNILKSLKTKSGGHSTHGTYQQRYRSCKHGFTIGRYVKDRKLFLNTEDIFGPHGICR